MEKHSIIKLFILYCKNIITIWFAKKKENMNNKTMKKTIFSTDDDGSAPPPTFRAWHFSNPGRDNAGLACGQSTFTNIFYTNYQTGNVPAMGSQLYLNPDLSTPVGSGNLWYLLQESIIDQPTSYRIDNSGILAEFSFCP